MDLRELRYFAMVCSERNFTKAANRLHISQPSLSVALQKLENELGLNLLVRDNPAAGSRRAFAAGRAFGAADG